MNNEKWVVMILGVVLFGKWASKQVSVWYVGLSVLLFKLCVCCNATDYDAGVTRVVWV